MEVGVMESVFDWVAAALGGVFGLAQGGFDGVNQVVGLLIAMIAALLMPAWSRLWASALGAALAHVAVGVVRAVVDGGAFVLRELRGMSFSMGGLYWCPG